MKTNLALVIGGTGMLAEVVRELSSIYGVVGVVGRTQDKLNSLSEFSPNIFPMKSDYSEIENFEESLKAFTANYEKPSLIVSWVHSSSPDVPILVSKYCEYDFYDIVGSSGRESSHISRIREQKIVALGLNYHRVILGTLDGRWLTNEDISTGVLQAIKIQSPEFLVGN